MTNFERARSAEQKDVRIAEIIGVAKDMLATQSFESISMSKIAKRLSFSRGNLYKYFDSKEEIFLTLLSREMLDFCQSLRANMNYIDPSPDTFTDFWVSNMAQATTMLTMLSMTGTILEKNVSDDLLLSIKQEMAVTLQTQTVPIFMTFFPNRSIEQNAMLAEHLIIIANGLFPWTQLSERQATLLEDNGLGVMVHQFEEDYRRMVDITVRAHIAV